MWFLEEVNLYDVLCPHKLRAYMKNHFKRYSKGEFIYMEADHANQVFLVSKGKVKLAHYTEEGSELVKAILTRGELFGEKAILGEMVRNENATALSDDTVICPLILDDMYKLMRKNERFSLTIYKIIGYRLKKLERRLELLFFKDVRTRLLDFINDLIDDKSDISAQVDIPHFYTQKDIADLIGTRRETVSKLFQQFEQEGILIYKRKYIRVLNWQPITEVSSPRHMAI